MQRDDPRIRHRLCQPFASEHVARELVDRKALLERTASLSAVAAVHRHRIGRTVFVTMIVLQPQALRRAREDPGP
jgi:hypothetical protein